MQWLPSLVDSLLDSSLVHSFKISEICCVAKPIRIDILSIYTSIQGKRNVRRALRKPIVIRGVSQKGKRRVGLSCFVGCKIPNCFNSDRRSRNVPLLPKPCYSVWENYPEPRWWDTLPKRNKLIHGTTKAFLEREWVRR
jgi:hypothetical protein